MIELRKKEIIDSLLSGESAVLNSLIKFAQELPNLGSQKRIDSNRVSGCTADAWLVCSTTDGILRYEIDSESMIIKGIMGVMQRVYSGATADEVLATPPTFLQDLGVDQHLTANRRNGLGKVWFQIRDYAISNLNSKS